MARKENIISGAYGGAPTISTGPSSLSSGPDHSEGHPKAYGGSKTISGLRDGSLMPNGASEQFPSSYGTTDGNFVKRHVQKTVKGSGDRQGAGSASSSGSLGA